MACLSGGRTTTERASWWSSGDGGRPKQTTTIGASSQRKDLDDGLRRTRARFEGALPPPCGQGGLDRGQGHGFCTSPTVDEVDRLYRQRMEIHAIDDVQLAEGAR
jgi:hypothetical protein